MDNLPDNISAWASNFCPRAQSAKALGKLAIPIFEKASMMNCKLFNKIDIVLENLRCDSSNEHHPHFRWITVLFAWDYLLVLSLFLSFGWRWSWKRASYQRPSSWLAIQGLLTLKHVSLLKLTRRVLQSHKRQVPNVWNENRQRDVWY